MVRAIRRLFGAGDLPRTYWFLWAGTIVNRLGGFVLPFLTLYLTGERGLTVGQAGVMVSLFGAGSFVASLVGGELADRLGRRPVMLLSLFLAPIAMLTVGMAIAIPLIAASTLALGFFTDLYRPAVNAAVADLVPPAERPRAYGYIYWAINLGAAIAPLLAGLMARRNYLLLFIGDALTTFLFGLLVVWGVSETRPSVHAGRETTTLKGRIAALRAEPYLIAFAGLALVFGTIYQQGYVAMPVDMRAHGLTPELYGLAISLNGGLIVLLGIPASNRAARWPRFRAMAVASLLLGIGYGILPLASGFAVYALSVAVWTMGEIAGASVAPTVVADLSPTEMRGLYQGVFGAAWGLAHFAGPVIGGWVMERFGAHELWLACLAAGIAVAAGHLAIAPGATRRIRQVRGEVDEVRL
jgi:MFS family permease